MKQYLKFLFFCLVIMGAMIVPVTAHAWGNSGYGWGRVSFSLGTSNSHTLVFHDASTGAITTPDTAEVILSNPTSGIVAVYSCSSSCPSTITLTDTTGAWNNIRVDHNSYITKAGYNTAVSPGGFFLDPGVTTPSSYNGTLNTRIDVFLTPTSQGPQIDGITPPSYDYYSYVPNITEQITPVAGATSATVTLFKYQYDSATGDYLSHNFGPFTGTFPQTITLGLGTPYPDTSDLQLANFFVDNLGNRSSTGTFNFGLDTHPPHVFCTLSQNGDTIYPTFHIWSTVFDDISGVQTRELSYSSDGGTNWNVVYAHPNTPDAFDSFDLAPGGSYMFRYRALDYSLQTDGSRGQWSPYVSCGSVRRLTSGPGTLGLSYNISTPPGYAFRGSPETLTTTFSANQDANLTLRWTIVGPGGSVVYNNPRTQFFAANQTYTFSDTYTPLSTDGLEYYLACLEVDDTSGNVVDVKCFDSYYLETLYTWGTIFVDANNDGVWDTSSEGIYTAATITLFRPDGTTATATPRSDGYWQFIDLTPGTYNVALNVPGGYRSTTPRVVPVSVDRVNYGQRVLFGIRPLNVGETSTPLPACAVVANPASIFEGSSSNITATCTDTDIYSWSVTAPSSTYGVVVPGALPGTAIYSAPATGVTSPQVVTVTLRAFGPGGGPIAFPVDITVRPRLLPWIQTQNGDVHSNSSVNTPGGPP